MKFLLDYYYKKTHGYYPFFKYCPRKYKLHYLKQRYFDGTGEYPDFDNPKTFNEKIWWLLFNEDLKIKTQLTDKVQAKIWVAEKIGKEYISETYGEWNNYDEINFESLPKSFMLKANHGWRMNLLIKDKEPALKKHGKRIREKVNSWLKINYEHFSLEPQYRNIEKKIFAEEYTAETNPEKLQQEYQFHCFNGKPDFLEQITATGSNELLYTFYDMDYNKESFSLTKNLLEYTSSENEAYKSGNFEKMKELAAILSEGFTYVRVDFRETGDRIIFGEMTFSPNSGMKPFYPQEANIKLGEKIIIPGKD